MVQPPMVQSPVATLLLSFWCRSVALPLHAAIPRMRVSIPDGCWRINGEVTCRGAKAKGLLLNDRMVNARCQTATVLTSTQSQCRRVHCAASRLRRARRWRLHTEPAGRHPSHGTGPAGTRPGSCRLLPAKGAQQHVRAAPGRHHALLSWTLTAKAGLNSLPICLPKRAALRLYPPPITGRDPLAVKKRAADPEPVRARFQKVRQGLQIDPSRGKQFDVRQRGFQRANITGADAFSRKYFDHHRAEFPGANNFSR